ALADAAVLSRAQPRQWRPRARIRSLRGTSMTDSVRHAPLAMNAAEFKALGDQVAELLAAVPSGPVTANTPPAAIRDALDLAGPLPEEGADPGALLQQTARQLFAHSLFNGHPRFYGYITSSPAPIGMLGDMLAAAGNANVGSWT